MRLFFGCDGNKGGDTSAFFHLDQPAPILKIGKSEIRMPVSAHGMNMLPIDLEGTILWRGKMVLADTRK